MSKLALSVALAFVSFFASAQITYTSANNKTDYWDDASTWSYLGGSSPTVPGNPTTGSATAINIYGYVTVPSSDGSLTVNNGSPTVTISDTLVVMGDFNLGQGNLVIASGGLLVVTGNLNLQNGLNTLTNNGNLVVGGNLAVTNGKIVDNTGSDLYVFGTSSVSNGGNINGCTGSSSASCPTTTGGVQSATDLANNNPPLNSFVNSLGLACGFSNTISASQSICSGSTAALTGNQPASVTYQWQVSTTSATTGFSNISSGATAYNYSSGSLTQVTYYRRQATKSGCTNSSPSVTVSIYASGTWTGASSTAWATTSNWCGSALPTVSTDAIIPTGLTNYPIVTTATPICRNLQIQSSNASVTINGGTLTVAGNITNNGTLTASASNSTIVFNGSTQQTVTGGPYTFYNLTVSNTNGVVFASNITVSNTLNISGTINMSSNTLTLGTYSYSPGALTYTASSTGKIINGTFTRYTGNGDTFWFPMGSASDIRPISFQTSSYNAGTLSVSHTASATTTNGLSIADASTIAVRQESYWTISSSGLTTTTQYAVQAGGTGFGTVGNLSDLRIMHKTSAAGGTNTTATGNATNFLAQRTSVPLSDFSNTNYYIGSVNATRTPLPVTLIGFIATNINDGILLNWSTATELNFDYFSLQKSSDGQSFYEIAQVQGHGTTNVAHSYSYEDKSPLIGKNYYRLTSVDFDNYQETFKVIEQDYTGAKDFMVSPTLTDGTSVTFNINFEASNGSVTIYDQLGSPVASYQVNETSNVLFANPMKSGIYLARYSSPVFSKTVRFVVK